MTDVYASGEWHVRPGQEQEFVRHGTTSRRGDKADTGRDSNVDAFSAMSGIPLTSSLSSNGTTHRPGKAGETTRSLWTACPDLKGSAARFGPERMSKQRGSDK